MEPRDFCTLGKHPTNWATLRIWEFNTVIKDPFLVLEMKRHQKA